MPLPPRAGPPTGAAAVLSIGKLAPGQHDYYLDTVAAGVEEYYTAAGEAPGRWTGRASAHLGLAGEVRANDLGAAFNGRSPGAHHVTATQGQPRVPGFDCTLSAPMSVSLVWALGPPEVASQVRDGHDAAVDAAPAVFETEASRARRARDGLLQVDGDQNVQLTLTRYIRVLGFWRSRS